MRVCVSFIKTKWFNYNNRKKCKFADKRKKNDNKCGGFAKKKKREIVKLYICHNSVTCTN